MSKKERNLWIILLLLTLAILALMASAVDAQTPTPTPTPDPCEHCPDPESPGCWLNWDYCVQCWEDCGQPIATPTPTPTRTPTVTPTPTPTPTPLPGPPCPLSVDCPRSVYLVAVYAHEKDACRYRYTTGARQLIPGETARPGPYEGHPIGFEWHDGNNDNLIKSCGDTARACTGPIFEDGFESGNTAAWSSTSGG